MVGGICIVIVVFMTRALPCPAGGAAPFRDIPFEWRPPNGPKAAYEMADPLDQHHILLHPGVKKGGRYPVVVGFHGQPKRGKNPRDYMFRQGILETLAPLVETNSVAPFVLVLPVFRFLGQNWPGFDPKPFRDAVETELKKQDIETGDWYAFGHSGAAGCGGDGLNLAHRLSPKRVAFIDVCLGEGWQREIQVLKKKGISTLHIHSVETAGFRPKQRPEYQSNFDFGRAFAPLGLKPVPCEGPHPGEKLRNQPFRCAATDDGLVRGFIVDTGEGVAAHEAALKVGFRFFLMTALGAPR